MQDSKIEYPAWTSAEENLLRSLVHVSIGGHNYQDPRLSWREIADRMSIHVASNGPFTKGRIYDKFTVYMRWRHISISEVRHVGLELLSIIED